MIYVMGKLSTMRFQVLTAASMKFRGGRLARGQDARIVRSVQPCVQVPELHIAQIKYSL
jgi:hypothetical protein